MSTKKGSGTMAGTTTLTTQSGEEWVSVSRIDL